MSLFILKINFKKQFKYSSLIIANKKAIRYFIKCKKRNNSMTINKLSKKILNVNKASIKNIEINKKQNAIFFEVEIYKGAKHRCPICGKRCSGYDTISAKRAWRAMDLGSYKTFIVSKVDRICCKEHGVVSEFVPRARHNS